MSNTHAVEGDVGSFLKVVHNAACKASAEYADQAWSELSYTLGYLASVATAASKATAGLALEGVRELVVPEEIIQSMLELDDDGETGNYL